MAYCLGIIPKSMMQEILKIADLRNQFAHNFSGVQFSDKHVKELCEVLDSHLDPKSKEDVPAWWTPRKDFERTIFLLVNELLILAKQIEHRKRHPGKDGDWLMSRGR